MSSEQPALGSTLRAYAIAQVLAILVPFVLILFGIDLGSSANIGGAFAAALFAAHTFVKNHGRAPTSDERRRLVWLSFAICWTISMVMVAGFTLVFGQAAIDMFKEILSALPGAVLIVIILVVSAIYLGVFHLAYGTMARNFEKKTAIKRL